MQSHRSLPLCSGAFALLVFLFQRLLYRELLNELSSIVLKVGDLNLKQGFAVLEASDGCFTLFYGCGCLLLQNGQVLIYSTHCFFADAEEGPIVILTVKYLNNFYPCFQGLSSHHKREGLVHELGTRSERALRTRLQEIENEDVRVSERGCGKLRAWFRLKTRLWEIEKEVMGENEIV